MFGFVASLVGDAVAPLLDAAADFSARLLRKLALFLAAALCMLVVLIALTIAFDLWIASLAGPIAGALAVAGVYLLVAILAVVLAIRDPRPAPRPDAVAAASAAPKNPQLGVQIDQFTKPILDILQRFGLKREQLAVFAGATMAKRLGPLPLVGCAIVVGFLVGRLWKSWRHVLEAGFALSPFLTDLFASNPEAGTEPPAA